MYYVVINYSDCGFETLRRDARTITEAYEKARETPHASVDFMSECACVLRTQVFSPKHPVPSADEADAAARDALAFWSARGLQYR